MNTLGIVPARAGSKGIPNKNTRLLAGRPLLAYAADAIRESRRLDRVLLSTDSDKIAELGRSFGLDAPFLRPAQLARDETPMLPVLQHAVKFVESEGWRPDFVVILQPTSPLRRGSHIDHAVELLERCGCTSVVSVVEIPAHYAPQFAFRIVDGRLEPYTSDGITKTRRQDVEKAYSRDGTVYAIRRDAVMERGEILSTDTIAIVLNPSESVNLDSPEDWVAAEARLAR